MQHFIWSGRVANELCAAIKIDASRVYGLSENQIKDYVTRELVNTLMPTIIKSMKINSMKNMHDDSITYTGTITASPIVGAYNSTISTSGTSSYSQINMRVVEYTKAGKVTRVELQRYDDHDNQWYKIPRIQIEE